MPFVYDVHHHRCLPDGLSEAEVTARAIETWDREPLFHVSSPINGWEGARPSSHHDFLDPADLPAAWLDLDITVDIEAKAKEVAIGRLAAFLRSRRGEAGRRHPPRKTSGQF